ncbi:His/Gly/Thr/Pro-type tRNA ligase C-terminal domain-containing protein [Mycoplasmopsis felis]|uniref:His/Gly/Thr/Pro-type tRNA ligase C-terminal domain-containing protein n=1 Tax=Mycoplasmopsis felis TaxID=33923 RepID=UPI003A5C7BF8
MNNIREYYRFRLAPKQITVIPATNNEDDIEYAKEINQTLFEYEFRSKIDLREERLSKKVRDAQTSKSKIQVILGEKERITNTISYRLYGKQETTNISLEEFLLKLIKMRNNYE